MLGAVSPALPSDQSKQPWRAQDLMEPFALAGILRSGKNVPLIVDVGFPRLYRQRHIAHSVLAGPCGEPKGRAELTKTAARISKAAPIVIYCGCCPMIYCPNVAPAYRHLKDLGYEKVSILNLPANLHADWTAKGDPVEP
jgi:thiosulfate/3-mercaptopyruvate sulfurtransferase